MTTKRFCGLALVGMAVLGLSAGARAGNTLHVATTGSDAQDGLTWETAKQTVAAGLGAAAAGDEVWVARGVYVERITLVDGVALYGGFIGRELTLAERPGFPRPAGDANETVLDGNQGGSVVVVTSTAAATRIDGFTIRNGLAANGGGINCESSTATIVNNTITANAATSGGGLYCVTGSPQVWNNRITGNTASSTGGAMAYCGDSQPNVAGNTMEGNWAGQHGGGVYCDGVAGVICGNLLRGNTAGVRGGGVFCSGGAATLQDNCIVENGAADGGGIACVGALAGAITVFNNYVSGNTGGGIYGTAFSGSGTLTIANNTIFTNIGAGITCNNAGAVRIAGNIIAVNSGGGIRCQSSGATILNNIINGNTAYCGAGISCDANAPLIANCLIIRNTATSVGGGIYCSDDATPMIVNCTIADNTASNGGAVCNSARAPTIVNCIVAFNSSGLQSTCGTPVLSHNDVFGNADYDYAGMPTGVDDVSVDPLLGNPAGGNYHLVFGSPCIDTGDDAAVQVGWVDIDWEARIQGAHVDIGSDEFAWIYRMGACCVGGVCALQLEEACLAAGGTYRGMGTFCMVSSCPCAGDANCDHCVNWRDIDYLIAAQNDNDVRWQQLFEGGNPPCPFANLDTNTDGRVNWRDIDSFIALMNTTCR